MKEGFNVASLTSGTTIISDMAFQQYLANLTPAQRTAFLASNVDAAVIAVNTAKNDSYMAQMDKLTGADNSITSAAYYLTRSQDLTNAAVDLDEVNLSQLAASEINAGLSKRQKEINEWANLNKLDTLYFMQVLFISLSLTGFLAFLSTNGSISPSLFTFVSYIIGILAAIILLLRWRYTNVARDSRYWHKSRFQTEDAVKISTSKCKKGWLW